jgi:peptidoglycan/xylan/chitin deacetylase (PgdA/CDA1 family)
MILNRIKRSTLHALKAAGVFHRVRDSRWRQSRLLILCYHGISIEDEHQWRPALYMTPQQLESRLAILKRDEYNVLPLAEGLTRLQTGDLPLRSVVLTFDDGGYDFYKQAYPLLQQYGFPATVYQTTYYSGFPRPVFNLICSYMLWKRRNDEIGCLREFGIEWRPDVRTVPGRRAIVQQLVRSTTAQGLTGQQRDELAARLAKLLGIDYDALVTKRILHLMNPHEIGELAAAGVDFQLHTHRHRTPSDEILFRREIKDNRDRLRQMLGTDARVPAHFCYPSGVYELQFLPWLAAEQVVSATTCDVALASRDSKPLLLPRFIDTTGTTAVEFESWLTGVGQLLTGPRTEETD